MVRSLTGTGLLLLTSWLVSCGNCDVATRGSCTGRLRVCREGESPFLADGTTRVCSENKLDRATVILTGGAWWTSVYNLWVAQILLEEQLQVPVKLEFVNGGSFDYWNFDTLQYDTLDGRVYSWDALHLASNGSMDCSNGFRQIYGRIPEDLKAAGCTRDCLPCAHAILEVWPNGQEANYAEYVQEKKTVEDGGALGSIGEFGWWASSYILDEYPLLSSFRGLMLGISQNSSDEGLRQHQHPASVFKEPLTLGEYCNLTYYEWEYIQSAFGGPPQHMKASNMSHFCHLFMESAMAVEHPSLPWSEEVNEEYNVLRWELLQRCASNQGIENEGLNFYKLCVQFWITPADLDDKLQVAATGLNRAGYAPDTKFLYPGYFVSDQSNQQAAQGVLQTTTCPTFNGMKHTPGEVPFNGWDEMGFGNDGYTRFENYDPDIIAKLDLNLRPISMQSDIRHVLEVSARLRQEDPEASSPILISWSRPSSLFLRKNYTMASKPWGNYSGEAFSLSKVQLPEYEPACISGRRTYSDRCTLEMPFNVEQAVTQCGYPQQVLYKAFASKLKEYSPEAYRFLRRFKLSREDQEWILAEIDYSESPKYSTNHPTRIRDVVCEWVRENKDVWSTWLPLTANQVRCLGEIGDPFAEEKPNFSENDKVIPCSGHGTCSSTPKLLARHPNAGQCECDRGYQGDDCSGLVTPELLNVVYSDPLFVVVSTLDFATCLLVYWSFRKLRKIEASSVVIRTSHPLFMRVVLWCILAAVCGSVVWGGVCTIVHCLARPVFIVVPLLVANGAVHIKLVCKNHRKALNTEDITSHIYPILAACMALFLVWFVLYTPGPIQVRLETEVWLMYSSCEFGNNRAAFEALLMVACAYFAQSNCRLSWKLRLKPSYFNEMRDLLQFSFLFNGLLLTAFVLLQFVTSPKETEKFALTTITILLCSWTAYYFLIWPKFRVHFYDPAINNLKDGLFHPTGDPSKAIGDPVLDMPRVLASQEICKDAPQRPPSRRRRRSSVFGSLAIGLQEKIARSSLAARVSHVFSKAMNKHQKVHLENVQDLDKLDEFPSAEKEVLKDPYAQHDPTKRALAYRSPEMYLVLEKRLRIIMRENAELTRILEEHRIDPVTGDMDEDYLTALHRIETDYLEEKRALENHFKKEVGDLQAERKQERDLYMQDKRQAVARLEEEKRVSLQKLKEEQRHNIERMQLLEKDRVKLANTLRGTLPALSRFLLVYGLSKFEDGLVQAGIESTEKLILASEDDLLLAGMRIGHIRKLQAALESLEVATPMVVMPDGAVRPTLRKPTPSASVCPEHFEDDASASAEHVLASHGELEDTRTESHLTSEKKQKTKRKKRKKETKNKEQDKPKRDPGWLINRDPATGRKYMIHPITGETKWFDENQMRLNHGEEQAEPAFSEESDIEEEECVLKSEDKSKNNSGNQE